MDELQKLLDRPLFPSPPFAKLSHGRARRHGPGGGGLSGINFANPVTEMYVNFARGGEGVMPLLDRSLVSRLAYGGSALPEHHLQRFAKFIPSPVWNS